MSAMCRRASSANLPTAVFLSASVGGEETLCEAFIE
jgi:hypothetical protein